jgi:hypothetical protein
MFVRAGLVFIRLARRVSPSAMPLIVAAALHEAGYLDVEDGPGSLEREPQPTERVWFASAGGSA